MKICFVADAGSSHTKKWCKWFKDRGHKISVISFTHGYIEGVDIKIINTGANVVGGELGKLKYFSAIHKIKQYLYDLKPDIVNVHYATSYGTVVALSGYKNYVLSVWGSDIYEFPQKGAIHKAMLKFSLSKAKYIFSTSKAMAEETHKYTKKKIEITPFGVNMELFNPNKRTRPHYVKEDNHFIVGTVKSLSPIYGIEYLLKAVAILKTEHPEIPIQLRIAGEGPGENYYKKLAKKLNIDDITIWLGFISQEDAAKEWANMDIAVIPSLQESFGVSAVEAQACGTPVIISDVVGLREVTDPMITSFVVKKCDETALVKAMLHLYNHENDRKNMGKSGRRYVENKYELDECFRKVERLFFEIKK